MCAQSDKCTQQHTHTQSITSLLRECVCFFFRSSRVYLAAAHLLSFCFAFDHNNSKQFISSSMRILLVVTRGNRLAIIRFTFFFAVSLHVFEVSECSCARSNTEQYVNLLRSVGFECAGFFVWLDSHRIDCWSSTKCHAGDYSELVVSCS